MSDLLQDITLTVNLSEMTPTKYKQTIAMLNQISEGNIDTNTYSSEMKMTDQLSEEHKKLLETFK